MAPRAAQRVAVVDAADRRRHFQGFHDLYGHSAGDDALTAVARCISQSVRRPGDTAARYGGEEFAVLLPDTDETGAAFIAEKIRAAVQALQLRHVESSHHALTVSIGIATTRSQAFATSRALLNAADDALYEAKDAGRNRVLSYRTVTHTSPQGGVTVTPSTATRNPV